MSASKATKVAVASRSFSQNQDLRNELLSKFSNVRFNDEGKRLAGSELVSFLENADAAIVGLETIDAQILSQLPNLKIISKYGVGVDQIDLTALEKRGVKLGWKPGVNRRSVAELTLALMVMSLRRLNFAYQEAQAGRYRQILGQDLSEKTVGILGLGNVGKEVVRLLRPWGCRFLALDLCYDETFLAEYEVQKVDLRKILSQADVLSVHLPLTQKTMQMIGEDELRQIKKGAVLINTARGGIVEESALLNALDSNQHFAAAFDVFEVEPPEPSALLKHERFFYTPHLGGSSAQSVLAMGRAAIAGLTEAQTIADLRQAVPYLDS